MSGLRDEPAFPTLGDDFMDTPDRGRMPKSAYGMEGNPGMTYRQWAAVNVLAGLAADPSTHDPEKAARFALLMADALIAALEGTPAQVPAPDPER